MKAKQNICKDRALITGVIMLCNYGHGGDELRGRKERKKEVPGGGHGLDHDRDGGIQPWSRA